jgi:hypothetical protein
MNRGRNTLLRRPPALAKCAVVAAMLLSPAAATQGADDALAAPLCGALRKLLPEVRTYKPESARAQLVMEIAERFEYDGAKLRRVKAEIDKVTSASCPKEREDMLGILKMKSLADAVS